MDLFALPNPPSIEGMLSDMFRDVEGETPSRKAQDIIYYAWEVTDPRILIRKE